MPTIEHPEDNVEGMLYPVVEANICNDGIPLTAEDAQSLLGWMVELDGQTFPSEKIQFKDIHGKNVCCTMTERFQRRYYPGLARQLMFSILKGDWELNGDTVVIGKSGYVLDGKHRLIALALAAQEWNRNPERYPFWKEEPYIETIVVYGLPEAPRVVNTIGTGKSRSISDSLYATQIFGEGVSRKDAAQMAKMLEHAIRFLWDRTGERQDAYLPRIDHSDALDFVGRHPTMMECVRTVYLENGGTDRRLSRYLSLGYLSGLMYLMACSGNDGKVYLESPERNEGVLGDLKRMDLADQFIALLGGGDKILKPYRDLLAAAESQLGGATLEVKLGFLIKAWNHWANGKPVTSKNLCLNVEEKEGKIILAECPTVGGIDQGPGTF